MQEHSLFKLNLLALLIISPLTQSYAATATTTTDTATVASTTTTSATTVTTTPKKPAMDYKGMAHVYANERSGFNGWSAGAGLGVNTFTTNTTSSSESIGAGSPFFSGGLPGNSYSNYGKAVSNKFGPMGNLFVGYGYLNDVYFGGLDLGVNFLGATQDKLTQSQAMNQTLTSSDLFTLYVLNYTSSLQTKTKVSRGWAEPFIDLKLGGLITPDTLAYLRGGFSYNTATIKSSSSYNSAGSIDAIFGPPPSVTSGSSSSSFGYTRDRNLFGLRLGAGMETLLTPHFGVGADYVYSFYPSFTTTSSNVTSDVFCDPVSGCATVASTGTNYTRVSLSDQQVMAKFTYHMG